MCQTQDEGQVVCKFFLQNLAQSDPEVAANMRLINESFDLAKHPNVLTLAFEQLEEKDANSTTVIYFAYRQFAYQSLLERMRNKIPKMTLAEKKWLVF